LALFFAAMVELEDDLGAEWLLELWAAAPTPQKASRPREAEVTAMAEPCDPSPTASSTSPAPCSNPAPLSTPRSPPKKST
jgi:hypothetical protein